MMLIALVIPVMECEAAGKQGGLKIYYLRHAQSGHNVLKYWEEIPKDQRPAYVGNSDTFSDLGWAQAGIVPDKLKGFHFDHIAVSPKWRTRNTILPYLKKESRKGEIWPELTEVAGKLDTGSFKVEFKGNLFRGKELDLPEEEKGFFIVRPEDKLTYRRRRMRRKGKWRRWNSRSGPLTGSGSNSVGPQSPSCWWDMETRVPISSAR
jgi:broad specificity phosphatase PhoE